MDQAQLERAHRRLLSEIEAEARATAGWTGRAQFSEPVMAAIAKVPRHAFVSPGQLAFAYDNRPLPIGHGQTISQPYIVAVMTDLLDLTPSDRVLEVGAGCGYQAAVLAEVAAEVFTVELIRELGEETQMRLARLGYDRVALRIGDGYEGWPEQGPFDGIIVTSAPPHIPAALAEQLKPGGRLVIPVGERGETQMLYRCVKRTDGSLSEERKLPVAFVPMVPGAQVPGLGDGQRGR